MSDLQDAVARSSDAADLHGTVPSLLLEAQAAMGALAARVSQATERGRRPFRPSAEWAGALGEAAYNLFLLADQSGVDLADAITVTARHIETQRARSKTADDDSWPFQTR